MQAQSIRFISTTGVDVNPCSLASPCKTLQKGINVTPAGGELRVLNSGAYGPAAVVNKSMTISGNGNTLIINQSPAITINAPGATVAVRDLKLNGRGILDRGIQIAAATTVHISKVEIERFQAGIFSLAPNMDLFVSDSVMRDNIDAGINVHGSSTTTLTIDRSSITGAGNGPGIALNATDAWVSRSVISDNFYGVEQHRRRLNLSWTTVARNPGAGIWVSSDGLVNVEFSTIDGNGIGLKVDTAVGLGATARISNSAITKNTTGIQNLGTVESRGNNTASGNGTKVSNPPLASMAPL